MVYRKGARLELEVVRYLNAHGGAAVRVAGSRGPVDVVGYAPGLRSHVAIQCKVRRSDVLYVEAEEMERLRGFARRLRARPFVAWKPSHRRTGVTKNILLLEPECFSRTKHGNYRVGLREALEACVSLDELVTRRLLGVL